MTAQEDRDMPSPPMAETEIAVAIPPNPAAPWVTAAGFAAAAALLFVMIDGRRVARAEPVQTAPAPAAAWAEPPPLAASTATAPPPAPSAPAIATPARPAVPDGPAPGLSAFSAASAEAQRRRAPSLVVDFGGGTREIVLAQAPTPAVAEAAFADRAPNGRSPNALTDSEQFAQRVAGAEPERVFATPMRNPYAVAPQGTIIPGVLETAINSDLPGFARAVVSRDVMSFDGKFVLIPRGSRVIGQYKSAVALGQSRAFVIWTRVIRPDGASIQIGSPGADALGRGGLDGKVNRHFFSRFSGSILLSVLNAGVASIGKTPTTQISVGSPAAAAGLASSIQADLIPPTIKVAQGEAINIFVARDLDFSAAGPAQ